MRTLPRTLRGTLLALLTLLAVARPAAAEELVVGSKKFTESVILGELAQALLRDAGFQARHQRDLGGTRVLWAALQRGDLDVYAEYTGTILQELLPDELAPDADLDAIRAALAKRDLRIARPFGFDNTYALAMREDRAEALGITAISDLARHPELKLRFSNEFMDRGDGWPALQKAYALPHTDVRGLDHDLAYRGLDQGDVDVMDAYATDAEIPHYGLRVLTDDRGHFPKYEAAYVWRADLEQRAPGAAQALRRLEGQIDDATMARLNARSKLDRVPDAQVAADFLAKALEVDVDVEITGRWTRLWDRTLEHLALVGVSLLGAVLLAVPLGIVAAHRPRLGQVVLGVVGILQTLPSLALLVFMIPPFGIGAPPAMAALFLYSLLPIVRNTHAGLTDIPRPLRESAEALGLPPGPRLRWIELPLAARSILAGVKTAAVINIGTATLGALIGAGGYGQPILTGIRLDRVDLIMEGAVPAAALALVAQGLFELAERWMVPRGLR